MCFLFVCFFVRSIYHAKTNSYLTNLATLPNNNEQNFKGKKEKVKEKTKKYEKKRKKIN